MTSIRPVTICIVAASMATVGLLGACSPGTAVVASPGCGEFQLVIRNDRAATVAVRLNGVPSTTVEGGAEFTIFEYGPGGVSAMPWAVEVVDAASGSVLATRDVSSASGDGAASIVVQDAAGSEPSVGEVQPGKGKGC